MYDWRGNFGWSISKSKTWNQCRRKFYFNTIKKNEKDPEGVATRYLADLLSLPTLKGKIIHKAISNQITQTISARPLNLTIARRDIERMLEPYRGREKNNLLEVINDIPFASNALDKIGDEGFRCLDNFANDAWPRLAGAKYLEHDCGNLGGLKEFNMGGRKVYTIPDYVSKSNDVVTVTDWKTGKEWKDGHRLQMAVYSMYAVERYRTPLENVRAELVYLNEPSSTILQASSQDIEDVEALIDRESTEMLGIGSIDDCPSTISSLCKYCNFASICDSWRERRAEFNDVSVEAEEA